MFVIKHGIFLYPGRIIKKGRSKVTLCIFVGQFEDFSKVHEATYDFYRYPHILYLSNIYFPRGVIGVCWLDGDYGIDSPLFWENSTLRPVVDSVDAFYRFCLLLLSKKLMNSVSIAIKEGSPLKYEKQDELERVKIIFALSIRELYHDFDMVLKGSVPSHLLLLKSFYEREIKQVLQPFKKCTGSLSMYVGDIRFDFNLRVPPTAELTKLLNACLKPFKPTVKAIQRNGRLSHYRISIKYNGLIWEDDIIEELTSFLNSLRDYFITLGHEPTFRVEKIVEGWIRQFKIFVPLCCEGHKIRLKELFLSYYAHYVETEKGLLVCIFLCDMKEKEFYKYWSILSAHLHSGYEEILSNGSHS